MLFLGTATGLETTAELVVDSGQRDSLFGGDVSPAGDVDGDGFDGFLVGASLYDNGQTDEGRAFLYAGVCTDPLDSDGDLVGDVCDGCPDDSDPLQEDDDADGIGDACDPCPGNSPDADLDGFCAAEECDDTNAAVYPGAPEVCDGLDTSCAGTIDPTELDEDGDGESTCAGDCDDADPTVFSTQTEQCNGLDDNCDGEVEPPCDTDDTDPTQTSETNESETSGCGCNDGNRGPAGTPLAAVVAILLAFRRRPEFDR
jgi:hypothetical protein